MPAFRTRKHEPTAETRKIVSLAAALDRPEASICELIGVKKDTLYKYYKEELKQRESANIAVGGALYKSAMGGNVTAQIFWCKTRLRWRETDRLELQHSGEIEQTRKDIFEIKGPEDKAAVEAWLAKRLA